MICCSCLVSLALAAKVEDLDSVKVCVISVPGLKSVHGILL